MASYSSDAAEVWLYRWKHRSYLCLLLVIWYLFSYVFNVSLKEWFRATEDHDSSMFPLLLTVFLSNAVAASLWVLHLTGCLVKPRKAMQGFSWVAQILYSSMWVDFCLLCTSGAIGIAAACIVLQHGSIQLVQVTRSVGPLFTALWAYLILDQSTTGSPLMCLGVTLVGTALASWQEPTFSALAFCLMLTVNMALTFRNAATKRILRSFLPTAGASPNASKSAAYFSSSNGGEGSSLEAAAAASSEATASFQAPEVLSCVLLALTNAVGLAGVLLLWLLQASLEGSFSAASSGAAGADASTADAVVLSPEVWRLLAGLGFCNFMYNMASQIFLAHVHVISHGMLELFKRIFVLVAASLLLGDVEWHWHNALGAAVATAGMLLYFFAIRDKSPMAITRQWSGYQAEAGSSPLPEPKLKHRHSNLDGRSEQANQAPSQTGIMRKSMAGQEKAGSHGWAEQSNQGRKLLWAYALISMVLVLSPVEFMAGAGVSGWSPAWLQPGAAWHSSAMLNEGMAAGTQGQASGLGSSDSSSGSNGTLSISTTSTATSATILEKPSLDVDLPNASFYKPVPDDLAGAVLLGGPHLTGLLPYHLKLGRASAPPQMCSVPQVAGQKLLGTMAAAAVTVPQVPAALQRHRRVLQLPLLPYTHEDTTHHVTKADEMSGTPGSKHAAVVQLPARLAEHVDRAEHGHAGAPAEQLPAGNADLGAGSSSSSSATRSIPDSSSSTTSSSSNLDGMVAAKTQDNDNAPVDSHSMDGREMLTESSSTNTLSSATSIPEPPGMIGIYTGWLGHDNLGDEIVADIFLDLLTAALMEATAADTCVTLDRASGDLATSGWRGCTLTSGLGCDFGIMGGGSTIYVDYVKRLVDILAANRPVMLFGCGYQSGLLQKSTNEKYLKMLCRAKLSGGVRGNYTKRHLQKFGCTDSIQVIRDSAVLADVLYSGGRTALRQQLQAHSGSHHVVVATLKDKATFAVFNSTVQALLNTGKFAVVLQAVDEESAALHKEFSSSMATTQAAALPAVMFHEEYRDWSAILDLYRHASGSLNSRLHSGVLSIAALRPTLYLATNIKYKDLMSSLDMRFALIDSSRRKYVSAGPVHFGEYLAGQVVAAVNQGPSIHERLQYMQQDTLQRYKRAMVDFLSQLEEQDPVRYRAMLCCQHIKVSRSTPKDHKVLVQLQCVQTNGVCRQQRR